MSSRSKLIMKLTKKNMQSSHSQNDRQAEQESEENTRETTCIQGESSCIENQSNELIEMTNVLYNDNIRIADEVTAQNCEENLVPEKMPSIEIQKLDNHSSELSLMFAQTVIL
ncbi:hypothetical protein FQA39_LY17176 [Lamprigera yunnana]|nr:hypothetical protein FQA39_LY17176 [Lamprigera yunnana]